MNATELRQNICNTLSILPSMYKSGLFDFSQVIQKLKCLISEYQGDPLNSYDKINSIMGFEANNYGRQQLTCHVIGALEMLYLFDSVSLSENKEKTFNKNEMKAITEGGFFIFYNTIYNLLDIETAVAFKMRITKENLTLFSIPSDFSTTQYDELCQESTKFLINLGNLYGSSFWSPLAGEFTSVYIQLCFSPRKYTEKEFFTVMFNSWIEKFDKGLLLKQLLLISGLQKPGTAIIQVKNYNISMNIGLPKTNTLWKKWVLNWCQVLIATWFVQKSDLGVRYIIKFGLEGDLTDFRKKESIARMVSGLWRKNLEPYYENIGPQIISLIKTVGSKFENDKDNHYSNILQILALMVDQLIERNKDYAQKYIIQSFLSPLSRITANNSIPHSFPDCANSTFDNPILHSSPESMKLAADNSYINSNKNSTDYNLDANIYLLHKIYVEILSPDNHVGTFISEIFCPLVKIATINNITHLKNLCLQILIRYIGQLDKEDCVLALMTILTLEESKRYPPVHHIDLTFDETLKIKEKETSCTLEDDERCVKCVIDILSNLSNPKITLLCLEKISSHMQFSIAERNYPTEQDKLDAQIENIRKINKISLLFDSIFSIESLSEHIFRDLEISHKFISNLLECSLQTCQNDEAKNFQDKIRFGVVMLLLSYIQERKRTKAMSLADWKALKKLYPTLKSIEENDKSEAKYIVKDLNEAILSHGVSVMSDPESKGGSKFTEAFNDLVSPHLPVKGAALIAFNRLLKERDRDTLDRKETLLCLFKNQLKNDDTFIYLPAIEGLVTLCDMYPDEVVPILTKEFIHNEKLSPENRVKLVESLTKVTERLGEILPKYRNYFINALLAGCRDNDELVRASSLSNLGDVSKHLKFSIGPMVNDIFCTLYDAVKVDKCPMVRRAAVMVITLIVRGLDSSEIKLLVEILKEINRFLKDLRHDEDEIVKLHCQLAVDEINRALREFLMPKVSFKKKIYITEVPPSL